MCVYLHITRILAAGPSGDTLPHTDADPLFRPFDCLFRLLYFLACPGDAFRQFWGPSVCFPFIFDVFLVAFTAPGAHARTVLPLQRELDPEGLGRSKNRCFFDVFSESKKKGIREHPFLTFCDFMRPEGANWAPKWFPNGVPTGRN